MCSLVVNSCWLLVLQLLIGFECGIVVLWDLKCKKADYRYSYDEVSYTHTQTHTHSAARQCFWGHGCRPTKETLVPWDYYSVGVLTLVYMTLKKVELLA